ncbi:MAG: outer membrane protein assembly factor BamD [Paracoccaceae bacterium]
MVSVMMRRMGMVALIVLVAACGGGAVSDLVDDSTPAGEIVALAQAELARGREKRAANLFMEVERLHPFTAESRFALVEAAKAYHAARMLVESRAAANRYLDYYPRDEYSALAQYLVALSYYDQIVDIQRDQGNTFQALMALRDVMENFPGTEFAALAAPKFQTALNQLAGKEVDVGRWYLRQQQYTSAIGRFNAVVDDYGDTPHRPEALHRLVEAYLSLGLNGQAAAAAAQLAAEYPESSWNAAAQSLLTTGRQPNAGGRFRY